MSKQQDALLVLEETAQSLKDAAMALNASSAYVANAGNGISGIRWPPGYCARVRLWSKSGSYCATTTSIPRGSTRRSMSRPCVDWPRPGREVRNEDAGTRP